MMAQFGRISKETVAEYRGGNAIRKAYDPVSYQGKIKELDAALKKLKKFLKKLNGL